MPANQPANVPQIDQGEFLSADARDVFAELVNVALGRAAVPLSELLETFVVLKIPTIECVRSDALRVVLERDVGRDRELLVVQQAFTTEFEGQALLFFDTACREMVCELLGEDTDDGFRAGALEVANIVLGACVGQLAELLSVSTRYAPPMLVLDHGRIRDLPLPSSETFTKALLVRTGFQLEGKGYEFHLVLLLPDVTLDWLSRTLEQMWQEM